jgi:hypothetical protein
VEWAKQFPDGINGWRCIFKFDAGKFYYADIPTHIQTEIRRMDLNWNRRYVPRLIIVFAYNGAIS